LSEYSGVAEASKRREEGINANENDENDENDEKECVSTE
jgi:hypothetical protein